MFNHPVQYLEKYSSTSYTTAIFMLASGHHGLEIKIWYYCTLYNSVCVLVAQSCLTLCNTIDHFLPGSSVHGIL